MAKIFDKEKIEAKLEIVEALHQARDAETDPGKRAELDAQLEAIS